MQRWSAPPQLRLSGALFALIASVGLLCTATDTHAQWKWRDAQGRIVYSDVPPPPSVPAGRIVQGPGSRAAGPLEDLSESPSRAPAAQAAATAAPGATRQGATAVARTPAPLTDEQAFQKRHEERLKAEAAERQRVAEKQVQEARCTRLRGYVSALESGLRASRTKPDGSIEYLDDSARKQELDQARETATRECA
jgi:hypothetical protein